jgi:hypothetical protein
MLVQTGNVPSSWDAFKDAVRTEFVPQDSLRRARDRLRKLYDTACIRRGPWLPTYQNSETLHSLFPGITEEEQFDRFCEGLKPEIKLEVLKSNLNK